MTNKKRYYITTPIFYPSGKPHIGHAYTTILGDFLKRFKQQQGFEAFFLTGTDEHGKKIAEKAAQNQMEPQEFVDQNSAVFKNLFEKMQIKYDAYVRTTNDNHMQTVQKVFEKLLKQNYIYSGNWSGWYCVDCEENYTLTQANKNEAGVWLCQIGHKLQELSEQSYFIKVSEFADWIKQVLTDGSIDIYPKSRVNELVNNFINSGLKDLAITRDSVSWGINVPSDPKQTIYVWFDALFSYLSGLGFDAENNSETFDKYWNNDDVERIHLLSKEITRFHCIYWPIFLKMLDIKLPTKILCHGWIIDEARNKMSKSLNNMIDPVEWIDKYGNDAMRYFLLKEMVLDQDNCCGENLLIATYNSDLANNLGNLVSRTIGMLKKYQDGSILPAANFDAVEQEIANEIQKLPQVWIEQIDNNKLKAGFNSCLNIVLKINKLIEDKKPWELFKQNEQQALSNVLYLAAAAIRAIFVVLEPVFINKSSEVYEQMNFAKHLITLQSLQDFNAIAGLKVNEAKPLFIRIDNNDKKSVL